MITLINTFLAYVGLGVAAGFMSGLLGVGGGLLVVPGLLVIFSYTHIVASGLIMKVSAASSLAAMIITTGFALKAHSDLGVKFWSIFRLFLPGMILGTITGTILAGLILPGHILRVLFGLFVLIMSVRIFLATKSHPTRTLPGFLGNSTAGFFAGLVSGMLGIGGSTLVIPYLIYYNVPMRNAIAITAAGGVTIAIVGTATFIATGWHVPNLPKWATGYVYWPAVIGVGIASPWFATLGAALSQRLSVPILRRVFAVFLLFIAIEMLIY